MEEIKKNIKGILNEYHGVQIEIAKLSQNLASEVLRNINLELNKISDGNIWDLISQVRLNPELSEKLKISMVTTEIEYQNAAGKTNGAFKPNKTKLLDDGSYSIVIGIKANGEISKDAEKQIEYVISHELNHAYVDVLSLHGNRSSFKYNKTSKMMRSDLKNISETYPEIKEFLNAIYLSNPLEVQARVQESFGQIRDSKQDSAENTIKDLLKHQPLSDARKMISYSSKNILKLSPEILMNILNSFNENAESASADGYKEFSSIESFFRYWTKVINKSGETLARKIYKLVSDKFTVHESELYEHDSFEWVFGASADEWFMGN